MFKKSLQFLLLLTVIIAPWGVKGQTLTVYRGDDASTYVPVIGYYTDNYGKCEFVMSADSLTDMNGMVISKMTFDITAIDSYGTGWNTGTFQVFMKEINASTISAYQGTTDATIVYEGAFANPAVGDYEITFTNEYEYQGGNLLIGIYRTAKGNYKEATFKGKSVTGASLANYSSSSLASVSATQRNFVPKTTFTYHEPPTCPKPTNLHANLTEGNGAIATLVWTETGTASNWEVIYGTDPTLETHLAPVTTGFNVDGSTISCNLTGLTAETPHYAKVKAVCEAGVDESEYTDIIEFTPSNFYTITVNDPTTTTSAYIPVYYYLGSYSTTKSQFIIPSTNLTNMQWGEIKKLTFYNQTETVSFGSAKFNVYLATTNNTTLSSFVEWSTMTKVVTNGSISVSGNKMEIVFDTPYTYTGGNIVIGFSQTTSGTSASYSDKWVGVTGTSGVSRYYVSSETSNNFLPKVTFSYLEGEAPSCLPVSNLSYSNEQATSVDLNWTAGGSDETAWKLQYKKTTEDDWTTYPSAITEKPFTLPGLSELTTYEWKVAAWCDTSNPDGISDYVAGTNFTTKQTAVAVGDSWSDNFEGESCGWQLINGSLTNANWAWGTAEHNGEGTHSIYITNDGGTTCSYNSSGYARVYAAKLLTFAEGKYTFQFDWKCKGETTSYDYLSVGLLPATSVITADNNNSGTLPTGWVALHDASYLNGVTTWQTSPEKTVQVAEGNYYLVLRWRQDNSGTEGDPAAVDNFSITRVACGYDVAGLEVATEPAPTAHTATINWTNGDPGQWQVAWSKDNTFAPANTNTETVSTNTINLVNLDAASTYYVKVRAYCGGEDYGTWSNAIECPTECEAISDFPWSYNFNTDATGNFSKLCWINDIVSGSYKFKVSNSTNGSNITNQLYMYYYSGSVAKLVLPELAIPTGKTYQFVVDVYRTAASESYNDGIGVYANTTSSLDNATQLGFLYRVRSKTDGNIVTAETTTGWYTYAFDIPYDGSCFVILKGEGQGGNSTYVDNFVIRQAPDCDTPTGLAVTANSQTPEGATITWDNVDETSWIVEYKKTADEDWTAIATPVLTNTYTFTGLDAETSYQTRIKVNCSTGDGVTYPTDPVQFTTQQACPAPKNLVVNGVTASTATFSWTAGYDETSWTVKYKKHADAEYTTAEPNPVNTNSITINELTGGTTYDVQIIGCEPTHIYSVSNAFTTAYGVPFTEAFTTNSQPANWNQYSGLMENVLAGTESLASASGIWLFTNTNVFGAYHAKLNIFGLSIKHWLVTPNIEIGNDNYNLNFDIALTKYNTANAAGTDCDDDKFAVLITTDNGATWSQLALWDNAGSARVYNDIKTNGEEVNLDLSSYKNQIVRIAFYGESTVAADNGDNDLHIDNVSIDLTPACFRPSGLTASDVTNHSATLIWTAGSNEQTAWEFKYNKGADFDPTDAGTLVEDIDENPYTFDKTLDAASTYYFYVRGNCGGEPSAWSKTVCSFTTGASAPAPSTFAKTDVGSDWVDLYWTAPAGDFLSGYGIYYATTSTEPTAETEATVTIDNPTAPTSEAPYRLTGLTSETTYYIWVRANHETNVYSAWKAITGASIITLPSCPIPTDLNASNLTQSTADLSWAGASAVLDGDGYTVQYRVLTLSEETETNTETFAGYTAVTYSSTGELPTGWKGYTTGTYKPHVSSNSALGTSYDITGIGGGEGGTDNFLYMIGNSSSPYNSFTILPQLGSIVAVSFDYAFESASYGTLSVGYCTDNTSGSTFTAFDDLTITATATSTHVELTAADIAAINDNKGYLAFRWNCNSAYGLAIDNVAITAHTYDAGAWQTAVTGYKTGYTYQLTGLTTGTKYDARVYSGCTTDADNENASTSFTTLSETIIDNPKEMTNIAATECVIVKDGGVLTLTGTNSGNANNLIIEDGGQVIHNNAVQATLQKDITASPSWGSKDAASGWYLIASPVANLSVGCATTGNYDFYKYDEEHTQWLNQKVEGNNITNFEQGIGYLYANKETTTIDYLGSLVGTNTTVTKALSYANTNDDQKGFNLMGNPFSCNITGNVTIGDVALTTYYAVEGGNELVERMLSEYPIKPGQGFMVQATAENQDIVFNPTSKDRNENKGYISIKAGNSEFTDNAFVQIANGNTLRKMTLSDNSSIVYVMNGGKDYAAARIDALEGSMPVCFKANKLGSYTITIEAKDIKTDYLHLIDNFTHEDIDLLLEPSYSFIASNGDNASRFTIVFRTEGSTVTSGDIFAYQNGSDIVVNGEGELQVFDVMGRLIATQHINGVQTVNVNANGVYIFKLNEKTQKIVVR